MSPYALPEGNVLIAFSGGRTSAFMLRQIIDVNGGLPQRAVVSFQNTGREMPETLDFVREVGERWQIPVVWLEYRPAAPGFEIVNHNSASRDGEPFAALIQKRRYLPNQAQRFCTQELKLRVAKRFLVSLGWTQWTTAIGIRADERGRISDKPTRERWVTWHPLADAGVTKRDVAAFWSRQPFDLRLPNIGGKTPWGNCDGCFLKSESVVAALARDMPDRHAWWEEQECSVAALWRKLTPWQRLRRIVGRDPDLAKSLREAFGRPIPTSVLKDAVENNQSASSFSKRYRRADLRRMIERQGDWLFSDEAQAAGVLCQADDGECVP